MTTPKKKIIRRGSGVDRLATTPGGRVAKLGVEVDGIVWTRNVMPEPVRWLWEGYLPRGRLVEFIGDPGVGKSSAALDIAARVSAGEKMPDGSASEVEGVVLVLKVEDGNSDVAGRLEALGADPDRVGIITEHLTFPAGADRLREMVRKTRAQLVIVDGFASFLGGIGDGGSDSLVRRAVRPLMEMADELDVTILVIRHLVKGDKSSAVYSGNGSIAFTAIARSSLLFAKDPNGGDSDFVMALSKANFGKSPTSLRYTIKEHSNSYTFLDWTGESSCTADDLVQQTVRKPRPRDEAVEFLRTELASGPVSVSVLEARAAEAGISQRTLRRAGLEVSVQKTQRRGEAGKVRECAWSL